MGASSGVLMQKSEVDTIGGLFTASFLRHGGVFLNDKSLRDEFVEFVKCGDWQGLLSDSDEFRVNDLMRTEWNVPDNLFDCGSEESCCERSQELVTQSPASMANSIITNTTTNEDGTACDSRDMTELFVDLIDMKPLLVLVLYPVFLEQVTRHDDKSIFPLCGSEDSYCDDTIIEKYNPKQRLLENILLRASQSVDALDLSEYLSNPSRRIVEDMKAAFMRLPVRVMIGSVDPVFQESRIAYVSRKSQEDDADGVIGCDLDLVCGNTCSPGTAVEIHHAIFSGRVLKKSYSFVYNESKLLAVMPIRSRIKNELMYTVSIESDIFNSKSADEWELKCSQIDGMLQLLPLLLTV